MERLMVVNSAVGIIYMASNIMNGKVYIGKTIASLDTRKWQHEHKRSNCTYFKRAIEKHGKDSFRWEIIDSGKSIEQLNQLENWWIEYMKSANPANGYNLMTGGQGSTQSENTKNKISKALKGIPKSIEARKNISKAVTEVHRKRRELLGIDCKEKNIRVHRERVPISEETRKKMSLSHIGQSRKMSDETRRKLSIFRTGKSQGHGWTLPPISEETRKKLSESHKGQASWNKGKKASEESRNNMRIAHIGQSRPQTEETKRKLKASITEWHKQRKEALQKGA
jgi:group I intron endonuclease